MRSDRYEKQERRNDEYYECGNADYDVRLPLQFVG
jgi:hypothetical protein